MQQLAGLLGRSEGLTPKLLCLSITRQSRRDLCFHSAPDIRIHPFFFTSIGRVPIWLRAVQFSCWFALGSLHSVRTIPDLFVFVFVLSIITLFQLR